MEEICPLPESSDPLICTPDEGVAVVCEDEGPVVVHDDQVGECRLEEVPESQSCYSEADPLHPEDQVFNQSGLSTPLFNGVEEILAKHDYSLDVCFDPTIPENFEKIQEQANSSDPMQREEGQRTLPLAVWEGFKRLLGIDKGVDSLVNNLIDSVDRVIHVIMGEAKTEGAIADESDESSGRGGHHAVTVEGAGGLEKVDTNQGEIPTIQRTTVTSPQNAEMFEVPGPDRKLVAGPAALETPIQTGVTTVATVVPHEASIPYRERSAEDRSRIHHSPETVVLVSQSEKRDCPQSPTPVGTGDSRQLVPEELMTMLVATDFEQPRVVEQPVDRAAPFTIFENDLPKKDSDHDFFPFPLIGQSKSLVIDGTNKKGEEIPRFKENEKWEFGEVNIPTTPSVKQSDKERERQEPIFVSIPPPLFLNQNPREIWGRGREGRFAQLGECGRGGRGDHRDDEERREQDPNPDEEENT